MFTEGEKLHAQSPVKGYKSALRGYWPLKKEIQIRFSLAKVPRGVTKVTVT